MPEAYSTVETGIFYLSRLQEKQEGWGLEGVSRGEKGTGFPIKDASFPKLKNIPDLLSDDKEGKIIENT